MGIDLYNLVISSKLQKGGGGGDIEVEALNVTENGTYSASSGYAFDPVTVSVPQSGITPTGTSSITANGIYDITNFASVDVNVSGGGGGGFTADDIAMRTISGAISGSATSIESYAFYSCSALTTASFPNVTSISNYAFNDCSVLTTASFPNVTSIAANAFRGCIALTTAIFLASTVATLGSTNAFVSTPMSYSSYTGSFGSIYVPASLVSNYKAATNWSKYADRITSYVE